MKLLVHGQGVGVIGAKRQLISGLAAKNVTTPRVSHPMEPSPFRPHSALQSSLEWFRVRELFQADADPSARFLRPHCSQLFMVIRRGASPVPIIRLHSSK